MLTRKTRQLYIEVVKPYALGTTYRNAARLDGHGIRLPSEPCGIQPRGDAETGLQQPAATLAKARGGMTTRAFVDPLNWRR